MAKIPVIEFNSKRLYHLMSLFGLTEAEILDIVSEGLSKRIDPEMIFGETIKLSHLKKIDKIFDRGLSYYVDPSEPSKSPQQSIFFRKTEFNGKIKLDVKQLVSKYEQIKVAFNTAAVLSDQRFKRYLQVYEISDAPEAVAKAINSILNIKRDKKARNFLKNFIQSLSDFSVLVLEYVESPSKKDKVNIEGFYLNPNVIVIKRNQISIRREIFTLAHEFGHYLLQDEEIDADTNVESISHDRSNKVETWCNEFAFCLLAHDLLESIDSLPVASPGNDYHHDFVKNISVKTHLSELAIYTRMYWRRIISTEAYRNVQTEIREELARIQAEQKADMEKKKTKAEEEGRTLFIPPPSPIISPLYSNTLKKALYEGVIEELDFCKRLNLKPEQLENYLYESNY